MVQEIESFILNNGKNQIPNKSPVSEEYNNSIRG